ncbi:hypothetical protein GCM10027297_18260 [Parahaliea aestuarii]
MTGSFSTPDFGPSFNDTALMILDFELCGGDVMQNAIHSFRLVYKPLYNYIASD